MTKIAAQCTRHCAALFLGNFSLLFPSFLSSCNCNVNPSLLLGLCLCLYNPFSLLIVVYYYLLPGFMCICCLVSLSLSLCLVVYPTPDYHCSVFGPVSTVCDGSWICCSCCCYLILPTFLCLGSPYFFHILSCLLVVAVCHVIFSPFLASLCSHFVDCCVIFSCHKWTVTSSLSSFL